MYLVAELIGIFLVGYGIWFTYKGIVRITSGEKDWWRPTSRRNRYPYPVAGTLLGICFVVLGLRFALNSVWEHARVLSYVGIGLFALVLITGIVQPRFLHPRWYGQLQDRLGREGLARLRRQAFEVDAEEWAEIVASDSAFEAWVNRKTPGRVMPGGPPRATGRGYSRSQDRETDK
jgi:hypothetical protein